MNLSHLESLTRVLQASISPVALISGVGLLILSLTNRFSRLADRLRELSKQRKATPTPLPQVEAQIRIFHRRARILRLTVGCAIGSVLLASVLVLLLFAIAVLNLSLDLVALALFALSLASLIVSLALFLLDMRLSLEALEEELRD
jgi:hypothetical protein